MNETTRLELTEAETNALVRRGIAKGRRRLAGRRALTGVSAVALVGALGVGIISIVGPSADVAPGEAPTTPPAPALSPAPAPAPADSEAPIPTPAPSDPTPPQEEIRFATDPPVVDTLRTTPEDISRQLYETLGSLLPTGLELSDFSSVNPADNEGRWATFTLTNGSESTPGHVLVGPPGTYGEEINCQSHFCSLTPVGEGQLMYLDGAADGKDGSPASWVYIDPAGRQVVLYLKQSAGVLSTEQASSIVSDDAWRPIVADEAANPTS